MGNNYSDGKKPEIGDMVRISSSFYGSSITYHFRPGTEYIVSGVSNCNGQVFITITDNAKNPNEWPAYYFTLIRRNKKDIKTINKKYEKVPQNNDGRSICFWCGNKTKKVQGFMSEYDVCERCRK